MSSFEDIQVACQQRVGMTVGQQWRLDALVGVGGMGAVYRAQDLVKKGPVAVKMLHAALSAQGSVVERFLRESTVAASVRHEGAVEILGKGTADDGSPFIVMELLEGQSLEDILEAKGRLTINETLGVADGVLAVLSVAHSLGVVHRDVKPENIFITNDRKLKLLDFGISRVMDDAQARLTSDGSLLGTPWYMPPEQALGRIDDIGPTSDIWAVGAVLFRALTGEPVHPGDTPGEVIVAAATRPARSLATLMSDAPVELVMLVDQALSYDPSGRMQDARAFRSEIRQLARALGKRAAEERRAAGSASGGSSRPAARNAARAAPTMAAPSGQQDPQEAPAGPRAVRNLQRLSDEPAPARSAAGGRPAPARAPTGPVTGGAASSTATVPSSLNLERQLARQGDARSRALRKLDGLDVAKVGAGEVEAATRLWEGIDRALTARVHYGPKHPQAVERMDHGYRGVAAELAAWESGLLATVTPYGFRIGEHVIWEPRDQLSWIPYRAFASGVRVLGLLPGIERHEFDKFLHLLTLDPLADMHPEDDLVTLLWESEMSHVVYREVDTFSEGDHDDRVEFERERARILDAIRTANTSGTWSKIDNPSPEDSLTGLVSDVVGESVRAEAVARSLGQAGDGTPSVDLSAAVELSADALRVMRSQLDEGTESTSARFYQAAGLGYAWARGAGKHEQFRAALLTAVEGMAGLSGSRALGFVESLLGRMRLRDRAATARMRADLVGAMLSAPVLAAIDAEVGSTGQHEQLLDDLERVLGYVDATVVPDLVGRVGLLHHGAVLDMIVGLVPRHGRGIEARLGSLMLKVPSHVAMAILRVLGGLGTDEARHAAAEAGRHPDAIVRIAAMARMGQHSSPRFGVEMHNLLSADALDTRIKGLEALREHKIVGATTALMERIRQKSFNGLSTAERRLTFDVLADLAPERAERIAVEVLGDRKLLSTPANEETREIAAQLLGRIASTPESRQALEHLARSKLGASRGLRDAATGALESLLNQRRGNS